MIHTAWEENDLSLRVQGSLSTMVRISLFERFKHKQLSLELGVCFRELSMKEAFGSISIIEVEEGLYWCVEVNPCPVSSYGHVLRALLVHSRGACMCAFLSQSLAGGHVSSIWPVTWHLGGSSPCWGICLVFSPAIGPQCVSYPCNVVISEHGFRVLHIFVSSIACC